MPKKILVIGGAGYIGSVLVPKLLDKDYYVRVLDTFWFGSDVFNGWLLKNGFTEKLDLIDGDIRKYDLKQAMSDVDCIIHLACISNDPSFELNPKLGRSINYDAFLRIIEAAKDRQIRRFIFASSSSVYGIKKEEDVSESLVLEPLTDYSKYKAFCEMELRLVSLNKLPWVTIRPGTICGYAPRLRLDLTVNLSTISALTKNKITVYGGGQKRCPIHIDDITDLYVQLINEADEKVIGKIFNAAGNNYTVMDIAVLIKSVVEQYKKKEIGIEIKPTDDLRSYPVSCKKIEQELGWRARHTISDAARDLINAFDRGEIPNSDDPKYYNIKTMQLLNIR